MTTQTVAFTGLPPYRILAGAALASVQHAADLLANGCPEVQLPFTVAAADGTQFTDRISLTDVQWDAPSEHWLITGTLRGTAVRGYYRSGLDIGELFAG